MKKKTEKEKKNAPKTGVSAHRANDKQKDKDKPPPPKMGGNLGLVKQMKNKNENENSPQNGGKHLSSK